MLRRSCVLLLTVLVPAMAQAGPLRDTIDRVARQEAARPSPGGWSKTRWSGLALSGAGIALVTMGLVEGKQRGPDNDRIQKQNESKADGGAEAGADRALLWTGIGAAALGGTLFVLGRGKGPRVSLTAGKLAIQHTVGF